MEFVAQHPVLVVSLVKIVVLLGVLMTALAYLSWFERKVIAHIQSRWGPYYVGAHGLLQPLADGVKFLFKEDLVVEQQVFAAGWPAQLRADDQL